MHEETGRLGIVGGRGDPLNGGGNRTSISYSCIQVIFIVGRNMKDSGAIYPRNFTESVIFTMCGSILGYL